MSRKMVCSLALGALALLVPAAGSAQTFVDVGVWTSGGGGRVVIGGPPVYQVPVYHAPVYRAPVYYRAPSIGPCTWPRRRSMSWSRITDTTAGRHKGWGKKGRGPVRGPLCLRRRLSVPTAATIGAGANDERARSIRARTPRPGERAAART